MTAMYRVTTNSLCTWGLAVGIGLGPMLAVAQDQTPQREWSSYFGGQGYEEARAVAVGLDGSLYVGGSTNLALGLPEEAGCTQIGQLGGWDVVLVKISPDGSQILWSAVLGGPGLDVLHGVEVATDGIVTICGRASSGFPTTNDREHGGGEDVFITQLDPNASAGNHLRYSTFLGGNGEDAAIGVVLEGDSVTVAGYTGSTGFPTTPGALQEAYQGGVFDLFVARLNPVEDVLVYSTFLGSAGYDLQFDSDGGPTDRRGRYYQIHMAKARHGSVVIATQSLGRGLPTTDNAYQLVHSGPEGTSDIYVAQIDPGAVTESQLVYGTYLGTSGWDAPQGVATDEDGEILVAAYSWSPGFPLTIDAADRQFGGSREGTLSRLDPNRVGTNQLTYSTFLGGSGNEYNAALVALAGKKVLVADYTDSRDYPVTDGSAFNGGRSDVAFTLIDLDEGSDTLGQTLWSTYFGGGGEDFVRQLTYTADGRVVGVGFSSSSDLGTEGTYQRDLAGDYDMFVCAIGFEVTQSHLFVRGDCNDDGSVDVSDVVCILGWLFLGDGAPPCIATTDTNGDSRLDITNALYLLNYLFLGGQPPVPPYPMCGPGTFPADKDNCASTAVSCRL